MPAKRFDEMIRIAAQARERVPDLEMVVIGDGYERENLEGLVQSLDAEEWIRMPGRVTDDELLDLYRRSWVVTSASIAEGWGMTLTEAAACGTPAVATRIAGHQDSVVHDQTGTARELVGGVRRPARRDPERPRAARPLDRGRARSTPRPSPGTPPLSGCSHRSRRKPCGGTDAPRRPGDRTGRRGRPPHRGRIRPSGGPGAIGSAWCCPRCSPTCRCC